MKQTSQAKQIELIIFLVIGKVNITPVRERERERESAYGDCHSVIVGSGNQV